MKNILSILIGLICIVVGCTPQAEENNCHLTSEENKLSISTPNTQ